MTIENNIIEISITDHIYHAPKWSFDYYGDRYLNEDYGKSYKYRHAKFRLPPTTRHPRGKPKCERFHGDDSDETILAIILKKYQPFKFKLKEDYVNQNKQP